MVARTFFRLRNFVHVSAKVFVCAYACVCGRDVTYVGSLVSACACTHARLFLFFKFKSIVLRYSVCLLVVHEYVCAHCVFVFSL